MLNSCDKGSFSNDLAQYAAYQKVFIILHDYKTLHGSKYFFLYK